MYVNGWKRGVGAMNHHFEQSIQAMAGGAVWTADDGFGRWFHQKQLDRERNLRLEEQSKERARIARELHDTLLQGFLGASMVLHEAVDQMPADSPSKPSLNRALQLIHRVIDEGRGVIRGLRSPRLGFTSLERALSDLADEGTAGGAARFRIFVMGKPKPLKRTIEEQVYLIAREALTNALRHSGATNIEAEVEYLPGKLRVVVRDNGSGIDPEILRSGRDSHWGLLGMRERAKGMGARLRIMSRRGAGTEVELSVAGDIAVDAHACLSKSPRLQKAAAA
jgi:signal transduction histidine kinase